MIPHLSEELVQEIRIIAESNPDDLKNSLADCLELKLGDFDAREKLAIVGQLIEYFDDEGLAGAEKAHPWEADFSGLTSLLLGRKISADELSADELSERLAQALNTVFDTLNQIVAVIQRDLLGKRDSQDTIRQIISSQIKTSGEDNSLQEYLNQIRDAFLFALKAAKLAAEAIVRQLLAELNPAEAGSLTERRLSFGMLRKAELFEVYREKLDRCKAALESGRITEQFLREFEKASQKIYETERRNIP